jgi:hypothetical protein
MDDSVEERASEQWLRRLYILLLVAVVSLSAAGWLIWHATITQIGFMAVGLDALFMAWMVWRRGVIAWWNWKRVFDVPYAPHALAFVLLVVGIGFILAGTPLGVGRTIFGWLGSLISSRPVSVARVVWRFGHFALNVLGLLSLCVILPAALVLAISMAFAVGTSIAERLMMIPFAAFVVLLGYFGYCSFFGDGWTEFWSPFRDFMNLFG